MAAFRHKSGRKNAPLWQFWPPSMTGQQMVSLSDESDNFGGLVDWKWNIIKEKCALFSNYSFLLPTNNSINEDSVLVKENHFLTCDLWAINLGCPSSKFQSEKHFSSAGDAVSDKWTRLKSSDVDKANCLKMNLPVLGKYSDFCVTGNRASGFVNLI